MGSACSHNKHQNGRDVNTDLRRTRSKFSGTRNRSSIAQQKDASQMDFLEVSTTEYEPSTTLTNTRPANQDHSPLQSSITIKEILTSSDMDNVNVNHSTTRANYVSQNQYISKFKTPFNTPYTTPRGKQHFPSPVFANDVIHSNSNTPQFISFEDVLREDHPTLDTTYFQQAHMDTQPTKFDGKISKSALKSHKPSCTKYKTSCETLSPSIVESSDDTESESDVLDDNDVKFSL